MILPPPPRVPAIDEAADFTLIHRIKGYDSPIRPAGSYLVVTHGTADGQLPMVTDAWRAARRRLGIDEIADHFGCSTEMARWRLNVTGARRLLTA